MNSSEYYLERVGFEHNVRLRFNLKKGTNTIGRHNAKIKNDFDIQSQHCSALHCVITVSDDSVEILNKSLSTGTTVNGIRINNESVTLRENDIIGIVRGVTRNLDGNLSLYVYRLRKYTSDNLLTIVIDDDEIFEISDEDDVDDDIIILDPVDIKKEHDLGIQLSRNFNAEVKQECQDIDEFEAHCKDVKKEPSNFFDIETTTNDHDENVNFATFDPHRVVTGGDGLRSDSNDSSDTMVFSPIQQENEQINEHTPDCVNEPSDRHSNDGGIERNQLREVEQAASSKRKSTPEVSQSSVKQNNKSSRSRESSDCHSNEVERNQLRKVERAASSKRKGTPEVSESSEKKNKSGNEDNSSRWRGEPNKNKRSNETNATESVTAKKEKPVRVNSSKPKHSVDDKGKTKLTPKVKYTKENRGTFLTDPSQRPGPPPSIKERRKSMSIVAPPLSSKANHRIDAPEISDSEIDRILAKIVPQNDNLYTSFKAKKLSFNDLRKPEEAHTIASSPTSARLEIENVGNSPETLLRQQHEDPSLHQVNTMIDNVDNSPETLVRQLHEGPSLHLANVDVSAGTNRKQNAIVKDSGFQMNPCHEIISLVTSYNSDRFGTVDAFCKNFKTNVKSFADTFVDYNEYKETILPLIMLELWKEIEWEYDISENYEFVTVNVTDKNVEKRGNGRRMVFQCQLEPFGVKLRFSDSHIVLTRCEYNHKKIEFFAIISYIKQADDRRLVHFTLETSALSEIPPISSMQIRRVTVISNTLNAIRSVYSLQNSPLLKLLLDPLSGHAAAINTAEIVYKGYDKQLDSQQRTIIKKIFKRCSNLNVPNVNLLDGAAGTGKTLMISNLALQLVYGDSLPKPLQILICSRSNANIDEITKKLLHVRNKTVASQKIHLVRYGLVEQMDDACRCVSVQFMKENEQRFLQMANIDKLEKEKKTLDLKIRALTLDDNNDNEAELRLWKTKLVRVNTLVRRLRQINKNKANDAATVLLNACDIICTTLGNIPKLRHYIPKVDVCIIDDATQCNESLTLLPFQFGMSSIVLVGDSRIPPPMGYSQEANEKNFGKSLFHRFQKQFADKSGYPIYRVNVQYRLHPEILKWPNRYFYNDDLQSVNSKSLVNFPIAPYKMLSYGIPQSETDNILLLVDVMMRHINGHQFSIGIICSHTKIKLILQHRLTDHPYITINSADESHLVERDVIIIFITKEFGIGSLCHQMLLNRAVTRARQCLLICGAELTSYKSRSIWKSIQEDAQNRKCFHHLKNFAEAKISNLLRRKV